ncbi:hypothetical protein VTL71DRAFT_15393 [Oculimacula yallundae]|uniref:Uncharacterized protein n=1 Tax=Oculimacula yallundae TaxID=86028 RepID=A0ABR4CH31_9HELO
MCIIPPQFRKRPDSPGHLPSSIALDGAGENEGKGNGISADHFQKGSAVNSTSAPASGSRPVSGSESGAGGGAKPGRGTQRMKSLKKIERHLWKLPSKIREQSEQQAAKPSDMAFGVAPADDEARRRREGKMHTPDEYLSAMARKLQDAREAEIAEREEELQRAEERLDAARTRPVVETTAGEQNLVWPVPYIYVTDLERERETGTERETDAAAAEYATQSGRSMSRTRPVAESSEGPSNISYPSIFGANTEAERETNAAVVEHALGSRKTTPRTKPVAEGSEGPSNISYPVLYSTDVGIGRHTQARLRERVVSTNSASPQENQASQKSENKPPIFRERSVRRPSPQSNQPAEATPRCDPLLWYQINVLCYDIRHYMVTTESQKRIDSLLRYFTSYPQISFAKPSHVLLLPSRVVLKLNDNIHNILTLFDLLRTLSVEVSRHRPLGSEEENRNLYFISLAPVLEKAIGIFDDGRKLENRRWFLFMMMQFGLEPPRNVLKDWDSEMRGVHAVSKESHSLSQRGYEGASKWRDEAVGEEGGVRALQHWLRLVMKEEGIWAGSEG